MAAGVLAASAQAADPQPAQAPPDAAEADRLWTQSWKDLAHAYVAWGDDFFPFLGYDKKFPSSVRIAERRMTEAMYAGSAALSSLRQSYLGENAAAKTRTLRKPAVEVQAAVGCLPRLAAGEYGWIHSGTVGQIIGPGEITLRQIRLVDGAQLDQEKEKYAKLINQDTNAFYAKVGAAPHAVFNQGDTSRWQVCRGYQTVQNAASSWWFAERLKQVAAQNGMAGVEVHVVGIATGSVKAGKVWPSDGRGFQLAVFQASGQTAYAAPVTLLEKGLSEAEVAALLARRKVSKTEFAEMVKAAQKEDARNWPELLVRALEKRKPAPAVPPAPPAEEVKPDLPFGDRRLDVELE